MVNVVTIAREFGAGGAETGRKVADLLGWEYLDKEIIERAAEVGHLPCDRAEAADERSQRWWDKVLRGFQDTGQAMIPPSPLDFDAMQTRLHPAESRIRKLSAEIVFTVPLASV